MIGYTGDARILRIVRNAIFGAFKSRFARALRRYSLTRDMAEFQLMSNRIGECFDDHALIDDVQAIKTPVNCG